MSAACRGSQASSLYLPPPATLKPRRLIIRDVTAAQVIADNFGRPLQSYQIDLTGLANADSRCPLMAVVQEQCNLGCWHDRDEGRLPCWAYR